MTEVVVVVGLPGCGKTTWAEQYAKEHPGTIRVNKDTIRQILHDGEYARAKEDKVCAMRDHMIESALIGGCNVVCDDTNLHPKHIDRIQKIAQQYGACLTIQDLTHVPPGECKRRDEARTDKEPVGKEAIMRMYNDYFENGKWKYATKYQEI